MDLKSSRDTADDGALDHHVRTALNVDPSPEFVARVRARVAREAQPGRWTWWPLAAAALAGLLVIAGITMQRHSPGLRTTADTPVASATSPVTNLPHPGPPQPVVAPSVAPVRPPTVPRAPRAKSPESMAVGSADERRSLRRLLAAVRAGDPAVTALLTSPSSEATASTPLQDLLVTSISVQPVTIEPLPPTR